MRWEEVSATSKSEAVRKLTSWLEYGVGLTPQYRICPRARSRLLDHGIQITMHVLAHLGHRLSQRDIDGIDSLAHAAEHVDEDGMASTAGDRPLYETERAWPPSVPVAPSTHILLDPDDQRWKYGRVRLSCDPWVAMPVGDGLQADCVEVGCRIRRPTEGRGNGLEMRPFL